MAPPILSYEDLGLIQGEGWLFRNLDVHIGPRDRLALIGRNGAGKTTLLKCLAGLIETDEGTRKIVPGTRVILLEQDPVMTGHSTLEDWVLAGEGEPYAGAVTANSAVGYLPQDPREGDLAVTAKDRVLSARGLDTILAEMKKLEVQLAEDASEKTIRRYGSLEDQFAGLGGYAAEAEAARICANLGLPDRVLGQTLGTLSGGQRRRIELARILFAEASEAGGGGGTLLLDEPTNHLDLPAVIWLTEYLKTWKNTLVVVSHQRDFLNAVVTDILHLHQKKLTHYKGSAIVLLLNYGMNNNGQQ